MNPTFTVIVDGFRWLSGVNQRVRDGEIAMLQDHFPGAEVIYIRESI
jgi:hypothetical protein